MINLDTSRVFLTWIDSQKVFVFFSNKEIILQSSAYIFFHGLPGILVLLSLTSAFLHLKNVPNGWLGHTTATDHVISF